MSNVQEALKAAIEVIEQAIPDKRGEFEEQQKLYENYPNLAYKYDYLKVEADEMQQALDKCKSALSEIEKCEPVGFIDEADEGIFGDVQNGIAEGLCKVGDLLYTSPQPIEKCEPVLKVTTNGSQLSLTKPNGDYLDMSKHIGEVFYTSPQPRELYAGDCVAYLYKDNNGGLKICNESPPPDKSFPVFITNLSFLDVARTVLEDCSDLIIKHGGVNLWKELIAKINRDYKQLNTKG